MQKKIAGIFFLIVFLLQQSTAQTRQYYKEPLWKPRAILPYADAIHNNFWPASPKVEVDYNDPGFDNNRLAKVPAPGIYPRVLITPDEVETIRQKLSQGEKAPLAFRVMWERVKNSQSPFFALVTNNDALGKKLAKELVQKIKDLLPKIDAMDKRPDRDNLWAVERSIIADGDPDPPSEIWDLLNYDYLHKWMSPEECELARTAIARITKNRISNFLMVPDHFMINNHEGFGMEYIRLMLLIEGQKGFDQKLFDLAVHKVNAMLDWYLDKDGMCYESIKGWLNISAFVSVGLRNRELLKHSHLMAKMHFFQAATRWEDGSWKIRDEMRASAFHVIWMMHYYHPKDESIDFLYQSTFSTHPFLTDASVRWPDPVGIAIELLLLYADNGITDQNGKNLNWNEQTNIDKLHLPLTWQDSARGYVDVRNSWRKDDLHVGFVCKQDFFYGGHEGSENNRLTLWKDGVNWIQDNNMLATKATFLQNMLTVDGMGCHWPPAPGNWLGVKETKDGLVAAGDGKIGFSYTKVMQVHPLAFPSAKIPYYAPFSEGNFDLSRDLQIAFQPSTIKWNDGYAHTDYGPWSGETRLVENYKPFNVMEQAYRTVQVAKGNYPYVIVLDDAKKDNNVHQFDWNISVPVDAELVDVVTPEVVFQNTEPSPVRVDDIILSKGTPPRDPKTGKFILKKGDPLCLIRVLWRNTEYGFPVPKLEKFQGYSLVTVPARTVSPEFRILIYPYRFGDPLPQTSWNKNRTQLTVQFKDQKDVYDLAQTEGGRTVLSMKRNQNEVLSSLASPARPVLIVRNAKFVQSELRYTRDENKVPVYLVDKSVDVQFEHAIAPAQIRYTLDGTEPGMNAALYDKPISINQSCIIKARVMDPEWQQGKMQSEILQARFVVKNAAKGLAEIPSNYQKGVYVAVYEINTKLYNDKGFFEASKNMMPDLKTDQPMFTSVIKKIAIPLVIPKQPLEQQCKGFYVNSCGPVTLDLAKESVIEATGIFHQQQAHRKGEVVLDKGWHPIELVICDPLFWNSNSLEKMPLEVSYQLNGNHAQQLSEEELICQSSTSLIQNNQTNEKWLAPISHLPMLEPGLDMQVFDRTGKRRDNDFLDIDGATPIVSERVNEMETTSSRNTIRSFSGFFYAPVTGLYHFELPVRNGENAGLGATQATCQNQLKIGDEYVLQRGVYGRNLSGNIQLKQGWYPISLRFGTGDASCKVNLPDGQWMPLTAKNIYRPAMVSVLSNNILSQKSLHEIYSPINVTLKFKQDAQAEIRYTSDGSMPNKNSAIYTNPVLINQTTQLTATAFKNGELLSAPIHIQFNKVTMPESRSLGNSHFGNWDGKSRIYPVSAKYKIWISPTSGVAEGMHGNALAMQSEESAMPIVDVNVSRAAGSKPGFKLYDIQMRENALTVALWFKTSETTGKLFGKDGYNAFGKAYKTFSCSVANGKLQASPNRLSGGLLTANEWQYVVLTANENKMALYLNGVLVANGEGTKDLTTDALDFFTGYHATVDNVQLFDRLLEPEEVKRLFEFGKK